MRLKKGVIREHHATRRVSEVSRQEDKDRWEHCSSGISRHSLQVWAVEFDAKQDILERATK